MADRFEDIYQQVLAYQKKPDEAALNHIISELIPLATRTARILARPHIGTPHATQLDEDNYISYGLEGLLKLIKGKPLDENYTSDQFKNLCIRAMRQKMTKFYQQVLVRGKVRHPGSVPLLSDSDDGSYYGNGDEIADQAAAHIIDMANKHCTPRQAEIMELITKRVRQGAQAIDIIEEENIDRRYFYRAQKAVRKKILEVEPGVDQPQSRPRFR